MKQQKLFRTSLEPQGPRETARVKERTKLSNLYQSRGLYDQIRPEFFSLKFQGKHPKPSKSTSRQNNMKNTTFGPPMKTGPFGTLPM